MCTPTNLRQEWYPELARHLIDLSHSHDNKRSRDVSLSLSLSFVLFFCCVPWGLAEEFSETRQGSLSWLFQKIPNFPGLFCTRVRKCRAKIGVFLVQKSPAKIGVLCKRARPK
mmetsp:Transcript_32879/g.52956  ORF Transcript_32879/g.52956 Transcript_32879/m.52956 type:complete len:113 (-) Transcript_32879:174-512(-)